MKWILILMGLPAWGQVIESRVATLSGTTLPTYSAGQCRYGERFFKTDATAGSNVYMITDTSTCTWTLQGGSATAAGGTNAIQSNSAGAFADSGCTGASAVITCTGGLNAGSGTAAGEVRMAELSANGTDYIAISVPDSVTTTYKLLLPAGAPSNQVLQFPAPTAGVSQGFWTSSGGAVPTKVKQSYVFVPQTQNSGGTGVNSMLSSPSSGGATSDTVGTNPWRIGRLQFADAATTSVSGIMQIPVNWDGGTVALDLTYQTGSGASGGQAVRWRIATKCFAAAADISAPTFNTADAVNATISSATANTVSYANIASVTMTGCSADNLLGFVISREGGDAGDTATATAYLSSVRLTLLANLE